MERSCEPIVKNRIEGAAKQGERARNRKARVIKAQAASIRRWCREGVRSCLGRSRLVGALRSSGEAKARRCKAEREVSRGRSSRVSLMDSKSRAKGPSREGVLIDMSMPKALRQVPARARRAGAARGEAGREPASDEACGPRHEPNGTGNNDVAFLHAAVLITSTSRIARCGPACREVMWEGSGQR